MINLIINVIIRFNIWFDNQKQEGYGLLISVALIFPSVAAIVYSNSWKLTIVSALFLVGLFFIRFLWVVMSQELVAYAIEHRRKG
jgi:hypothetical protein